MIERTEAASFPGVARLTGQNVWGDRPWRPLRPDGRQPTETLQRERIDRRLREKLAGDRLHGIARAWPVNGCIRSRTDCRLRIVGTPLLAGGTLLSASERS